MIRRTVVAAVILVVGLSVSGCGSNSTVSDRNVEPLDTSPGGSPFGATTLEDVDWIQPGDPADFPRAAVPVDAIPASEVLVEPTDADIAAAVVGLAAANSIVVSAEFTLCTLASVWAVPGPDAFFVSYEENPRIDCSRSVPRTALFVVPIGGVNSYGAWSYEMVPEVIVERVSG